jgi:DNA mismatch endonuclease, patch repair protein
MHFNTMDRHTPLQRSFNMSQVKSKDTKPELLIYGLLDNLKIRYRKHYDTYGKPDIAFPREKIAVFINGEFWHGRNFKTEKNEYKEFWIKKIEGNIKRDRKNYKLLKEKGWKIIKIWDKDLKKHTSREFNEIMRAIGIQPIKSEGF